MNVIACYKVVPDEQDIVVCPDRTLSFAQVEWKIGQYDLPALEAGLQLVEAVGGNLSALSAGSRQLENSKLKKGVLARGPAELFLVVDEALAGADSHQTARVLAAAVQKIGGADLILCGEGSADLYAQQVGAQLGELLNLPTVNAVSRLTVEGNKLIAERTLEEVVEVLEIQLPAVVAVTTDMNQPRLPGMKEILAAGKKPVTEWQLTDIDVTGGLSRPVTEVISTLAPLPAERKRLIFEGESEEVIDQFYTCLRKVL
ncbi:electron transfer flavoprotein [Sporomusa aerivorans]|uniref:electron transfer flavoprotein n=1 Tax=Sporomusa aerivorans TaxID=204936 RepID=UPI00352A2CEE